MLDLLYEKTIKKKNHLNHFFNDIKSKIYYKQVEKSFTKYEFSKEKQDKILAAVDGSFNKKKYMACFVYAISSQTIISKPGEKIIKESSAGDITTKTHSNVKSIDSILSMYMNILELKSTLDTLERYPEIDYMLMDGSIRGTLMHFPTYTVDSYITNKLKPVAKKIESKLKEGNFPLEVYAVSNRDEILSYLKKDMNKYNLEIEYDEDTTLRYIESLEQLTCIKVLLENFKEKLVCVSKTSGTNSLYKNNIPDAAVIEYTINESGYTNPDTSEHNSLLRKINGEIKKINYPLYNDELKSYNYTLFFTKLTKEGNVLKIELPQPNLDRKKIEGILEDLYSASINGYPYILKKAHDEVVIKEKNMKHIIEYMDIFEKTGRDML